MESRSPGDFPNLCTVCSSCKRKFVVCPLADKKNKWKLSVCKWTKLTKWTFLSMLKRLSSNKQGRGQTLKLYIHRFVSLETAVSNVKRKTEAAILLNLFTFAHIYSGGR